jgi:hypothetical protein
MHYSLDASAAYHGLKRARQNKVPAASELFCRRCINKCAVELGRQISAVGQGHMRDKKTMNDMSSIRRLQEDGLGPNSDIGNKLRALYGAVQEEGIPNQLLDLLDRLDEVERQSKSGKDE